MEKWTVKEIDYSLIDGFAYVIFVDSDNDEFVLQACLRERAECNDEQRRYQLVKSFADIYKKEIDSDDAGMDWGLCGEANEQAFTKHGEEQCWKQFKREMRNCGIRFINV